MKNIIIKSLCSTAVVLALASSAYAVPSNGVRFSTDGTTWTPALIVTDGGAGDLDATANGSISTFHAVDIGSFHLVVTTSFTFPAVGTLASPMMDLHVGGTTTGAGTLYVEFSSTGFQPVPTGAVLTTIAPNQPGVTETEITRIGATDAMFAPAGATFATLGPISIGNATSSGIVPPGVSPYTITIQDKFISSGSGLTLSTDTRLSVPDGGNTLMLLGSALSVLGLGVFRKSRKA